MKLLETEFDIAIILINYNSTAYTIQAINSIQEQSNSGLNFHIMVVDNNSKADELRKLREFKKEYTLPNFTLIESRINLGFSGGNMLGAQNIVAKYYYFLNNDCLLLNDCLDILYKFCEKNPNVALCSGIMYNENMDLTVNYQYHPTPQVKWIGSGVLRLFNKKKYSFKKEIYERPTKVEVISGSSMFIRASNFHEIGGFDTIYFLYCEEEDIAWNLRHFDCFVVPEAKYQHLENKSTVINYDIRKEFYISFLYYYRKNFGLIATLLIQIMLFFKNFRKFYKSSLYLRLSFFILRGAPLKTSLRYKQKIRKD